MSRPAVALAALACAIIHPALAAPEPRAARVEATLTWTPVPGATGYQLEIARDQGFGNVIHRASPARPRHVWTTEEGVVSYLRVRGVGVGGRSGPWSPARTIELRLAAPEPLLPEPGAVHVLSAGPLELAASPSPFVTVFRFQLSTDPTFQQVAVDLRTRSGRVSVETVAPGAWHWRVGGEDGFANQLPFSRSRALAVLPPEARRAPPRPAPPPPPPPPPEVVFLPAGPPLPPTAVPPLASQVTTVVAPSAPLVPPRSIVSYSLLLGAGWRGGFGQGGPAAVVAADAWPTALGGGLGLRLHLDSWSTKLATAAPGGARRSFLGWSVQAGVIGRATVGVLRLSAGLAAGALQGAASVDGASAHATTAVGQAFAGASLPLGRVRLGLELSLLAGRWSAGGVELPLARPLALLTLSEELP